MFPVTRIYETEHAAREALDTLARSEVPIRNQFVIYSSAPNAAEQVDSMIDNGGGMKGHRRAIKNALARGRSIVSVVADYGWSSHAEVILNSAGAIEADSLPDFMPSDPAPFSDLFGIPLLSHSKPQTQLAGFNSSTSFGFKMLSNNPAPLSSLFGLKLLSSKRGSIAKGSSVERMSSNPSPLSSLLGLKLLSGRRGSKASGSSVERMSGNPAPFSSLFGIPVLSKRR